MSLSDMTRTLKVATPFLRSLPTHQPSIARVSGLIVDTPSSFASGPSSGSNADSRHTLIKACVDAFHSMYTSLSLPSPPHDIICSKCHPRRRSRKAQRRDAASLWQSTHRRQNSQVRRGIQQSILLHPFLIPHSRSSSSTTDTGNAYTTTNFTRTCTAKRSILLPAHPPASWEGKQLQNSSSPPLQLLSTLATLRSTASAQVNHLYIDPRFSKARD